MTEKNMAAHQEDKNIRKPLKGGSPMSAKPTPTPWHLGKKHPCRIIGGELQIIIAQTTYHQDEGTETELERANAAFIVEAVNAHDVLISALHSIVNSCPATKEYDDIVAIAEKALSKAEKGE